MKPYGFHEFNPERSRNTYCSGEVGKAELQLEKLVALGQVMVNKIITLNIGRRLRDTGDSSLTHLSEAGFTLNHGYNRNLTSPPCGRPFKRH